MCDVTYTQHETNIGSIQKIMVSNIDDSSITYWKDLHALIKIVCLKYGFEPEIDYMALKSRLGAFIKKVSNGLVFIIIDSTGLSIKDFDTAENYIRQRSTINMTLTPNKGPILGII